MDLSMRLEELTQRDVDMLYARAKQRSMFAAIVAGVMSLELTSTEGLAVKRTMMETMMKGMEMGIKVGDEIEQILLHTMKDHCEEQLAMEDLMNSANL